MADFIIYGMIGIGIIIFALLVPILNKQTKEDNKAYENHIKEHMCLIDGGE